LPATPEWINRAKVFLKDKWGERHKELGREGVPTDLKGACKFASLFAHKLFGGKMVGTADHQALSLGGGSMLDLTDLFDPNTFRHDKEFWMNPEHEESMKSIEPRVQQWVDEFMQLWWQEAFKTRMGTSDYHQNVGWLLPDGSFQPLKKGESHREGAVRIGISTDPQDMTEAFNMGAVRVSGNQYTTLEFKECSTKTLALLLEFILQKRQNAKAITLDWFKPRRTEQEFLNVDDVVQWLETSGTSVMASGGYLYHGTTATNFERIMLNGGVMEAGSYWGTERIAATYAEEAVDAASEYDAGEEEAIIRVPLARFNKAALKVDDNSVAEPMTYTLKRKEEDLYADWEKAKGTWQDSLRIYESVQYDAPITITKKDRYV